MSRIGENIIRFRWPIILGFVVFALFFGSRIPRARSAQNGLLIISHAPCQVL